MKTASLLCALLLLLSGCAGRDYRIPADGLMDETQMQRVDNAIAVSFGLHTDTMV